MFIIIYFIIAILIASFFLGIYYDNYEMHFLVLFGSLIWPISLIGIIIYFILKKPCIYLYKLGKERDKLRQLFRRTS